MELPKDPVILLSYVNTQLRDFYKDLTDFCIASSMEEEVLKKRLASIGYEYDESTNQFI